MTQYNNLKFKAIGETCSDTLATIVKPRLFSLVWDSIDTR